MTMMVIQTCTFFVEFDGDFVPIVSYALDTAVLTKLRNPRAAASKRGWEAGAHDRAVYGTVGYNFD